MPRREQTTNYDRAKLFFILVTNISQNQYLIKWNIIVNINCTSIEYRELRSHGCGLGQDSEAKIFKVFVGIQSIRIYIIYNWKKAKKACYKMYYLGSNAPEDPAAGEFTVVVPLKKGCCFKSVTVSLGPFGEAWAAKNGLPINTGIE